MAGGRYWTAAEDAAILAAKLTPHTERFNGPDPKESLTAVAARLGRTAIACSTRRDRLERRAGRRGLWTTVGLWAPDDDEIVMSDRPLQPVADKLGRTLAAVRTRRCNLRRADGQARIKELLPRRGRS